MTEAVYVRFAEEELSFIQNLAKEEKITRSEAIQKLVYSAAKRIRVDQGLNSYKEGKATIREAAEIAGLRYFEFFEVLAKENLLGTAPENMGLMLKRAGY